MTDRLRRLWPTDPRRSDAALAALLLVPSLVQVLVAPIASRPVGVLIAVASMAPIAARRSHPAAAAVAGTLPWLIPTDDSYLVLGYIAAFILYYSLAAYVADLRRVGAVVAFGLAATAYVGVANEIILGEWVGAVAAVVAPTVVGRLVRRQREQARRLEELAALLDRERERAEHAAVAEERTRIARELHDVVAHGVSVIAIQSDAAEAALDHDPALARAPLTTIRGSAREALEEMRRLLCVLRDPTEECDLAPQPGLAQIPGLVERSGVEAGLVIHGDPRPLCASIDLSAYRIVQEALTNARKHAPGAPASITLTWAAGALEVEVRDLGPGPNGHANGGHGLIGMRERVRLHGGELHTGPAPGGGFRVAAVLPLGGG